MTDETYNEMCYLAKKHGESKLYEMVKDWVKYLEEQNGDK